jgi:beta-galactosidase/beta-glucuronidase
MYIDSVCPEANTMKQAALLIIWVLTAASIPAADWKPVEGKLMTRWAGQVNPDSVWPEYPRPQMVRKDWQNLNGLWDYAITARSNPAPAQYDGRILVPFAIESALSGVGKSVGTDNCLWYRRTFILPKEWTAHRILLHFGAADWEATIWVNGTQVGSHQGGYDPFTFDITDAVRKDDVQELIVRIWDPTNDHWQPRGKQVRQPEGIWYTSVTGIWQTVWLEPVPIGYIESIKITPDVDQSQVRVEVAVSGIDPQIHLAQKYRLAVEALEGDKKIAAASGTCFGGPMTLKIPNPRLWSPEDPWLYNLHVSLRQSALSQRPAALPVRPSRPGLVAGWALHPAV